MMRPLQIGIIMTKFAVNTAGIAAVVPQSAFLLPERLFSVSTSCVTSVTSQQTVVLIDKI